MDRGLLANMDVEALIGKSATQPYARLWDYLIARWESIAARCLEEGTPFGQGALGWHGITPMVVEAALIHRLTGRADAKAHALLCIHHLLAVYGDPPTPAKLALLSGGRAPGGHTARPKVLSHGEVALAADMLGDVLPAETRAAVLKLMKTTCIPFTNFEHGLAGYSSGGNVILCQNINAAICALTWGAECGYAGWEVVVDNACNNIRQYLRNGCDPDGFSYEGTGYGEQVMQFIFLFCHLLQRARWHDNLLVTEPRLRRIPEAYQHMLLPDGSFAATTNDSGNRAPMSLWWMLMLAKAFERPDYRGVWEHYSGPDHPIRPWGDSWPYWAAISLTEPRHVEHVDKSLLMTFLHWDAKAPICMIEHTPLPTAICAEGTDTATFRTSWNKSAIFAAVLGGGRSRACFGHSHADCGHIDMAVGGEYLAVDTGRYNTNEDQHSVVIIDGKNRHESSAPGQGMREDKTSGRLGGFQRSRMLDYCVADASHMKSVGWALRHVLFIRTRGDDGYMVLLDNVNVDFGTASHEYWWQLQCATTARIDITSKTTATVHGKEARIDCAFFQKPDAPTPDTPHTLEVRQDVKEWVWPYGTDQDPKVVATMERTGESISSVRRPRLLAIQKTLSGMILSVLSPRRAGQETRLIRPVAVSNGLGIEVTGDGYVDTLVIAPDHKLILAEGLKCFSEFAMIRRDVDGHIVDSWSQSGEPIQMKHT